MSTCYWLYKWSWPCLFFMSFRSVRKITWSLELHVYPLSISCQAVCCSGILRVSHSGEPVFKWICLFNNTKKLSLPYVYNVLSLIRDNTLSTYVGLVDTTEWSVVWRNKTTSTLSSCVHWCNNTIPWNKCFYSNSIIYGPLKELCPEL